MERFGLHFTTNNKKDTHIHLLQLEEGALKGFSLHVEPKHLTKVFFQCLFRMVEDSWICPHIFLYTFKTRPFSMGNNSLGPPRWYRRELKAATLPSSVHLRQASILLDTISNSIWFYISLFKNPALKSALLKAWKRALWNRVASYSVNVFDRMTNTGEDVVR